MSFSEIMRAALGAVCAGLTALAMAMSAPGAHAESLAGSAERCAELTRIALPDVKVTLAQTVGTDQFPLYAHVINGLPGDLAGQPVHAGNPAFCRIAATLTPTADSLIRMEIWLPLAGWNHKLLAAGNFGWGGSIVYDGMLTALQHGYVSTSNDTGHTASGPTGGGGAFLVGHPQKLIDYAYRADHLNAVVAKAIIRRLYGVAATHAYFIGCSLGGLEALIEAKRYPTDYDGIIAGAPPNPLVHFNAGQLWPDLLVYQDRRRFIPREKYTLIHEAVLKACGSKLEQREDLLDRPDRCGFDPVALQCHGADAPDCLTPLQVELMRLVYQGPTDPVTHRLIFAGPAKGSELTLSAFGDGKAGFFNALDLFRYAVFGDPAWDVTHMHLHDDVTRADAQIGALTSVDANLGPFFKAGGHLLLYIGWNDYHNPTDLAAYARAVAAHSAHPDANLRLFLIPGMNHCTGGQGCDTWNKLGAIDAWVDRGVAPTHVIIAKFDHGESVRTRPLCAYPFVATYKGSGNIDDAANFLCRPG